MEVKSYPKLYIDNLIYLLQNISNIDDDLVFTHNTLIEKRFHYGKIKSEDYI